MAGKDKEKSRRMDFEKDLNRLEEIVQNLESSDLPLEDSLKLYEEGVKLLRVCQKTISEAERKVMILKAGKIDEEEDEDETTPGKSGKSRKKKGLEEKNFSLFDEIPKSTNNAQTD